MTYVLALLAAILGAGIGAALGIGIATALAPLLGISGFEGAAGYFAVFIGGPIGGIAGLVLGAVLALRRRGITGVGPVGRRLGLIVLGIAALAGAALGVLYLSQDIVNPNGAAPQLVFEVKLPPGAATPRDIELTTAKNRMPALIQNEKLRHEDGRPVIAGLVEMYYRSTQRLLVVTLPDKTDVLFAIKLAAMPKHAKDFTAWQPAEHIAAPGQAQPRRATAADLYEIRYRADWAGEDQPRPPG